MTSEIRNPIRLRGVAFPVDTRRPRLLRQEPRFGVVTPAEDKPAVVMRDRWEVLRGFRSQELRMTLNGMHIVFSAASQSDGRFPFADPVLLASTSVRDYLAWPQAPADLNGLDHLRAVAVSADRQWIDRMLVLRDHPDARSLARSYGARYAMGWSKAGMCVIDLETDEVMARFLVRGVAMAQRPCPMVPGALPGDRCRMYGGPWVDSSMIASGYWLDRRFIYSSELGCDEPCSEPSVRHRTELPTRYFTWMWPSEIDAQWEGLVQYVRSH